MSIISNFWKSFDETSDTLEEHFSEFVETNDLSEEEASAIRTDIVSTLIKYFAQLVEDIHQSEQADIGFDGTLSSIDKIFDYYTDDCLGLEEDTKDLLARSLAASAADFEDEDDDEDDHHDDYYQVKRFLKALARTTPGPDKDYIDLDQMTDDEEPDPYGNHFAGGVKVFDRRTNRYGHGPNEETKTIRINPKDPTKVMVHPRAIDVQNKVGPDGEDLPLTLKGTTAAAASLRPNSKPGYTLGLSVSHHAVPGLMQYCDDNDIPCTHLGMGAGVQHIGFKDEDDRTKATRLLNQQYGQTSFKPFTRKANESAALQAPTPLEESLTHGIDVYGQPSNHDRLIKEAVKYMRKTNKTSSYSDGAMTGVRNQLQASAKVNAENPLFENTTSRDPQFLQRLDRGSK